MARFQYRAFSGDLTDRRREAHLKELLAEAKHQAMVMATTSVGRAKLL